MKNKSVLLVVFVFVLAIVFVLANYFYTSTHKPDNSSTKNSEDVSGVINDEDVSSGEETEVSLIYPVSGVPVTDTNPLVITGFARGNWFFEANIPVKVLDSAGNLLAQVGGLAEGEWMTTDMVPFKAVLNFSKPETVSGKVVISKDNPSGLPEHDKSVEFPIMFDVSTDN